VRRGNGLRSNSLILIISIEIKNKEKVIGQKILLIQQNGLKLFICLIFFNFIPVFIHNNF
jgi:hypothetical protein